MSMDLDNRLKTLNNLPEDEAAKKRIYERVHSQEKVHNFSKWKEFGLLTVIAVIALFLVILPTFSPPHQTADGSVEEIYSHFGGEEGKFYARGSSLYISVNKVEDDR